MINVPFHKYLIVLVIGASKTKTAKFVICSKISPNLTELRLQIACQYMQFCQSACMFHISYGLQWRQGLRYIADICKSPTLNLIVSIRNFDKGSFITGT